MAAPSLFTFKSQSELSDAYVIVGNQQRVVNPRLACQTYTHAIRLNPGNRSAYFARATLLRSQKMYREAAEDFEKLIYKLDCRQLNVFEGIASSYLGSGQHAKAFSMVSLGLHTFLNTGVNTSNLHLIAARAMVSLGNRELALAELEKALRIDPRNKQASELKIEIEVDILLCPPAPRPQEPPRRLDPTPPAPDSGAVPECRPM